MSLLFIVLAVVAVLGAAGVVLARTPVRGLLALIANIIALGVLFLTLSAEFMAVIQMIVYAGAIMVLFLFVIGLLSARATPLERGPSPLTFHERPAAVLAAVLAVVLIVAGAAAPGVDPAGVGDDFGSVRAVGEALFIPHVFTLQLAALVLLVAAVGVAVLMGRRQVKGS